MYSGDPLLCQLLSIVSNFYGRQMFVNIKKTADGSGCMVAFPRKYGGEARDWLKNIGFRF